MANQQNAYRETVSTPCREGQHANCAGTWRARDVKYQCQCGHHRRQKAKGDRNRPDGKRSRRKRPA